MRPENRVLVQRVIGVMANPVAHDLDRVKARRAVVKLLPDHVFKEMQIGFEVIGSARPILGRHGCGDPLAAVFRAQVKARVDQKRRIGMAGVRCVDDKDRAFARLHRNSQPSPARHHSGAGSRAVHGMAAGHAPGLAQRHRRDATAGHFQPQRLVGDELHALCLGRRSETGQQAHVVKPSLVPRAKACSGEIVDIQPRKPRLGLGRAPHLGCGPLPPLHLCEFAQKIGAFGAVRQEQIAVFLEAQGRDAHIVTEMILKVSNEFDAKA